MKEIKIKKPKFYKILLIGVFLLSLFQMAILRYSTGLINTSISYLDEIVTMFLLLVCFFNFKKLSIDFEELRILYLSIILVIIGTISSMYNQYQPILPSFIDAIFTTMKFIIVYFGVGVLYKKRITEKFIFRIFSFISKLCTSILFFLTLHDFFMSPFFQKGTFRFFTESISLFFSHETYLAFAGIILLIIHLVNLKYDKSNKIFMYMISFVILLTLRGKAIGFLIVFWGLYFWIFVFKIKKIIFIGIIAGISLFFIAQDQIVQYFFTDNYSPRLIMLTDGFKLAMNNFPLGTGFATFGSTMSVEYYSPIYTMLGYQFNYGMNQLQSNFLYDGFWPCIFAQFGIIGTITFILIIINFIKIAYKHYKIDKYNGFALLMILCYLIIASTSETSFFNPMAVIMFSLFRFIVMENKLYI